MVKATASVVVSGSNDVDLLGTTLRALGHLRDVSFEVIVVGDDRLRMASQEVPGVQSAKWVAYADANPAMARNLGILEAAGEIVAFLEPGDLPARDWLARLTDAVLAPGLGMAIGSNRPAPMERPIDPVQSVGVAGDRVALSLDREASVVLRAPSGRGILPDTGNFALRRDVCADLGGLDPSMAQGHDLADLSLRVARSGLETAVIGDAIAYRAKCADPLVGKQAVERIFEAGNSLSIFLRKHCPHDRQPTALVDATTNHHKRICHLLQAGLLQPDRCISLRRAWNDGLRAGEKHVMAGLPAMPKASHGLAPFPTSAKRQTILLVGRRESLEMMCEAARSSVASGHCVKIVLMSRIPKRPELRLDPEGFWLCLGSLWPWRPVLGRSLSENERAYAKKLGDPHINQVTFFD